MELEAESALLCALQALARHNETGDLVVSVKVRSEPDSRFWTAEVVLREEPSDQPRQRSDRSTLSHPSLTGMSREELDRLVVDLAALLGQRREQARLARRGAERRRAPGAGPKPKLVDADRVVATVLYLRGQCTQAVLGDLFAVDRCTITEAVKEVRPLLAAQGHVITPAATRFRTAADLLAFVAAAELFSAAGGGGD
jgi:hypothetical protein